MKKLMIAAAIVCAAAFANAANVNWSFQSDTSYAGNYTIYLTTSAGAFKDLAAIQAVVLGGDVSMASAALTAPAGARSASATGEIIALDPTTQYDFYYVAVKGNDYWVSGKQSVTTKTEDGGAATASFAKASGSALLGGTKTGSFDSVPEPTSAMLLLLGVAGLALKRKQK